MSAICAGIVTSGKLRGSEMPVALHFAIPLDVEQVQTNLRASGLECAPLGMYYGGGGAKDGLLCGFCAFNETEISLGLDQMIAPLTASVKPLM